MRAVYLALTNNTNEAIHITRVTSDAFASVSLHETSIEDGIARMRPMPRLEIPAGETVQLQRGGKHVMLMRPVGPGETMSLQFFDGDNLLLTVSAPLLPESE
jgi:copper(I)-binding protein